MRMHPAALSVVALLLSACVTWISDYDSQTYRNLTDLKAETQVLLERCVEQQGASVSELPDYDALYLHMAKTREYEDGKAYNSDTSKQVNIIAGNIKEIVDRLRQKKKLNPVYCEDKARNMAEAFKIAITTENDKLNKKSGE